MAAYKQPELILPRKYMPAVGKKLIQMRDKQGVFIQSEEEISSASFAESILGIKVDAIWRIKKLR